MDLKRRYEEAKDFYKSIGIDTEGVIEKLKTVPVSLHCWQGDDVTGFDHDGPLTGGIQTTGNYPGKARNYEELFADIQKVIDLTPGMKKINVQETDKHRMDEIAPHHQGLIAIASAYEYSSVEDILAAAEEKHENPFIVMLDGVTDPHNLGAIIRTAECVGAHGVIIPLHRSVGLTPAAVKASAGAVEHIKVARVMNLNRTIDELKKAGIWVYGLTMDGKDYEKVDFQGGTVLVIGAEGEGISRLTLERCDMTVSLPMSGKIDSLNASVAAGIMMYRVLSCRKNRK